MPQYSQTTLSQQSALATVTSLLLSSSPAIPSVCSAAQQPNLISTVATIGHIADQLWSARYLADQRVQQKDRASDNILSLLDKFHQNDRQAFRRMVRMWLEAFDCILKWIRDHKVFKANSRSPNFQLTVFLYRMGQHGNGASIRDVAHILGLSMGSVVNYSNNVTAALFDAHSQSLTWVTEDEKIKSKDWVLTKTGIPEWQYGFALVDRTLVPLQFTPGMEGHFDWKKNYSLNVQLVVLPHNLKIIKENGFGPT
ncbi:hypothetical protein NDA13_005925 [Ustilago tritici]|nr:hypothetical protein NDA13_005925 [Ustilago tritici]